MASSRPLTQASTSHNWREEAARSDRLARWLAKARIQLRRLLRRERHQSIQLTELVSELFVKWNGRTDFHNTAHFLARVHMDGVSVLVDRGRAKNRLKRGSRPHVESLDEERHGDKSAVDDQRRIEMKDQLDRAVAILEPVDAAIVGMLRTGATFGEIADKLGTSESTVRRRFKTVEKLLKSRLAGGRNGR